MSPVQLLTSSSIIVLNTVEKPELIFGSKEGNDDDDEVELDNLLDEL